MTPVHPEFVPDASLSREEMEQLQRDIADEAVFSDDLDFDPTAARVATERILSPIRRSWATPVPHPPTPPSSSAWTRRSWTTPRSAPSSPRRAAK